MQIHRRDCLRSLAAAGLAGCFCARGTRLPAGEQAARHEVPWLDEVQRPPASLPPDAPKLSPLLVDEQGRAIDSVDAWQNRREELRKWWLGFLKPIKIKRETPPALEILAEERVGNVIRQRVRYDAEPGLPMEGYLLKPAGASKPCPGVVALHSTSNDTIRQPAGVYGAKEQAFGLRLAERGWVAFCPCNFEWPRGDKLEQKEALESLAIRHPGSTGMAKMLFDAITAVDILASLPEVDPHRLGAVGHSLGAKEVLYLAAFDERIRVAVSSEGGIGTRFSNWDSPCYLGSKVRDAGFTHEHHELLAMVAPRPFLLIGGNSADGDKSWPFIESVLPVYRLYGTPSRIGLFNHGKGHSVPPEAERRIFEWFG